MKKRTASRTRAGTALLLIDFINPLDFPGGSRLAAGALRAAKHTAMLRAQARRRGVPTIYVNDHFGQWAWTFRDVLTSVLASKGAAIAEAVLPRDDDIAILKPRHSAFYGTPLEFLLDELGTQRLVLTGLATDNCVFATAQDAYVRKFDIWIPADCVAAESRAGEPAVLRHMARTLKATTTRSSRGWWPKRPGKA